MATHATTVGHSARPTDLPRLSRRDPSSRIPAKYILPSAKPKLGASPSFDSSNAQLGPTSVPSQRSKSTGPSSRFGNGEGTMSVAQATLNIPAKAPQPAPTSPQAPASGDSLTPSPSADTPPPPSLVSASSASSHDSPRSNMLRRKPSVIGKYVSDRQKTQKDSPFGQPLIQQIDTVHSQLDTSHPSETATPVAHVNHVHGEFEFGIATPHGPVELRYGADGNVLSRQTPISETSTTPSVPCSTSPSQFSQSTNATSLTSASPMIGFSPQMGMRSFSTLPQKTSPQPSEPLGHPFFQQTNQSRSLSSTNLPRPRTAPQVPPSPTRRRRAETMESNKDEILRKKPEPVHPPELAHLNTASQSRTDVAGTAPPRPSRDGIPSLTDHKKQRPIVQSNLPKLNTFQHRRTPSNNSSATSAMEAVPSAASMGTQQTPPLGHEASPQKVLPRTNNSQVSLNSHDSTFSPGSKTPDAAMKQKSRFGFFSKKPKSDEASSKDASKPTRKGPVAGTGHEGYGKHAVRIRSGSSSSSGSAAGVRPVLTKRKSSGASSKDSELDEFLQQRLSPVYMRGEGKDTDSQGRGSGSMSEAPSVFSPSVSSHETSHTSGSSFEAPKTLADANHEVKLASPESVPLPEQPLTRGRDPSEKYLEPPTLKSRSPSRKRLAKPRPVPKESALKNVEATSSNSADNANVPVPRPSVSANLARVESHESTQDLSIKAKKSHWFFNKPAKESKTQNKWNFFQRTKSPNIAEEQPAESTSRDSLSASANVPAHYLPTDVPAGVDVDDLDNIMREAAQQADDASSVGTDFEDIDDDIANQVDVSGQRRLSALMQSQSSPALASQTTPTLPQSVMSSGPQTKPSADLPTDNKAKADAPSRPTRLHPVGRIPPVTSRRDQVQKPPSFNFSRPFASPKPEVHSPPPSAMSAVFPPSVQNPQESRSSDDISREPAVAGRTSSNRVDVSPLKLKINTSDVVAPPPFIDFPTRKNSDNSHSSSSGTMHFPTATTIAHGPGRNSRASTDETWPEFDDLIDHVLTPSPSASSRHSKQYFEKIESAQKTSNKPASPKPAFPKLGIVETFPRPAESSGKSPTKLSVVVDPPSQPVGATAAALRDARSVSTIRSQRSNSLSNSYRSNESSKTSLKHKRSNSLPQEGTIEKGSSKQSSDDTIIHENPFMFRYRVLMTSKWLSFGRLLFSPIHNRLGNQDDRVLVIDGLGNRDWSYYCAVSYPQTQIYSLGPSGPSSNGGRASLGNFGNLPNYRHFCYTTPGTDFPFPKGFFAAVVYRFPVADSDFVMRSMISECKRVLRPGGYLEISTIDLDLANMGDMARRAVRNLKTQMKSVDQSVSLKPASDHIQSLVGRRGFENLNRCIVGVPAAGVIASSRENSADGNDVDFSKLASDNSKEGDEHITKMVSQVGRWWYTRCYEMGILPNGDPTKSMWCDRRLLKECEELSTTFKLLICYAQKPSCVKRRTVSL